LAVTFSTHCPLASDQTRIEQSSEPLTSSSPSMATPRTLAAWPLKVRLHAGAASAASSHSFTWLGVRGRVRVRVRVRGRVRVRVRVRVKS